MSQFADKRGEHYGEIEYRCGKILQPWRVQAVIGISG